MIINNNQKKFMSDEENVPVEPTPEIPVDVSAPEDEATPA